MNVNITFRHMDHTSALDQIIREKSEKFSKWFGSQADVQWICWIDGTSHCSEVTVQSGNCEYFAKANADDMYKSFDMAIHKIQNQLQ